MDKAIRRYLKRLGKKGGASKSEAKVEAARENLALAHEARRKYTRCKRYGSHRFSPVTGRCPCGEYKPGMKPKKEKRQRELPLQ
jgi:hypothetical protein